jgi:ATP synthase protein I
MADDAMSDDHRSPSETRHDADGDRKRLDDLDSRLRAARKGPERPRPGSTQREMSFAYRVMVEMIAGLGFGAFVGWWLDRWLGTTPILLVVMILLGFAAGVMNAYRVSQAYNAGPHEGPDET